MKYTKECYKTTASSNLRYMRQCTKVMEKHSRLHPNKKMYITSLIKGTFVNAFKGLEEEVATNECTCLVNRQLKQDRLERNEPSNKSRSFFPKIDVVVRKNETETHLVNFLYAVLTLCIKCLLTISSVNFGHVFN